MRYKNDKLVLLYFVAFLYPPSTNNNNNNNNKQKETTPNIMTQQKSNKHTVQFSFDPSINPDYRIHTECYVLKQAWVTA